MEYAIYEGNEFCSFSLKDLNGYYYEEFRKQMRKKSQENAFTCPECGENVILNAGPILPPYFSHHKGSKCAMQNNGESKEHREGRFLLYLLAKKSFSNADIRTNFIHENMRSSHVFIDYKEQAIALNFITSRLIIKDWEEKHIFYKENNINDVWILSRNSNLNLDAKNISLNSYLASQVSKTNTIKLLDTINRRITLLHFKPNEFTDDSIQSERVFEQESYDIFDVRLQADGEIVSFNKTNGSIIGKTDSKKERVYDESYNSQMLLVFHDVNEIKDIKYEQKIDIVPKIESEIVPAIVADSKKIPTPSIVNKNQNKIKEYAVFTNTMKNTFLLKATNMYWELPQLQGTLEETKIANAKRLDYFITQDKEIQSINALARKEKRILELKEYIESKIYAKDWIKSNYSRNRWR